MTRKRFLILCGVGITLVTLFYSYLYTILLGNSWMRNEGDLPPASTRTQEAEWAIMSFPFATFGLIDDIMILPLVNGLFWGFLLAFLFWGVLKIAKRSSHRSHGSAS